MPDRTKRADHGPSGLERSLVRSARAALGILYGGVALLGVLHLELWTTLLAVPFFSALLMGLRWSLHEALHAEAIPSIDVLLPAAIVGALSVPFAMGIQQLGDRGAFPLVVLIGLLTILGSHWLYRLEVRPDRPPSTTAPLHHRRDRPRPITHPVSCCRT